MPELHLHLCIVVCTCTVLTLAINVSLHYFLCIYRFNSLSLADRLEFSYEEDTLLSVILHNVLLFLLMMGVSPKDTIDLCHRLSAKTRLASVEEKLLQQTLSELENFVSYQSYTETNTFPTHMLVVVIYRLIYNQGMI